MRLRVQGIEVEDAHTALASLTGRIWIEGLRPSWFLSRVSPFSHAADSQTGRGRGSRRGRPDPSGPAHAGRCCCD
jgi:hypothetical protein